MSLLEIEGLAAARDALLHVEKGKNYMFFSACLIMIPGIALAVLVLGINLVGDGLRNLFAAERLR